MSKRKFHQTGLEEGESSASADGNQEYETELKCIDVQLDEIASKIGELQSLQEQLEAQKKRLIQTREREDQNKLQQQNWSNETFEWSENLRGHLRDLFKITEWRPLQLETINATLSGHDVLLIMPTGGGKSLTYQLPALISAGFTLVVSPLVSLMQDQLWSLEQLGHVGAAMMDSSSSKEHVLYVKTSMVQKNGPLKILYVTPERLAKSKQFMNKLEKSYALGLLSRIAIDEVHCCSQWGHDFRPDYKFLNVLKRQFPKCPIIGLTATATSSVIEDVKTILRIPRCLLFKAGYNRNNLFYEVRQKSGKMLDSIREIATVIKSRYVDQSGIVYCFSKKDAETVAATLGQAGIKAAAYHGDLTPDARSKVHRRWLGGAVQVVVATIAFGMGIDKPDVRFVIHHSLSKSLENYYQESGRAGRDDKPATCLLYFRLQDMFRVSAMVFSEQTGLDNLYQMVAYCTESGESCRRKLIAFHFDEVWNKKQCDAMCDHCRRPQEPQRVDVTEEARSIISVLQDAAAADQRLTAQKLMEQTTKGGGVGKLGAGSLETLVARLLLDQILQEDFHFTAYSTISYLIPGPKATRLLRSSTEKVFLAIKTKSRAAAASHAPIVPSAVDKARNNSVVSSSPWKKPSLAAVGERVGTKNHLQIKTKFKAKSRSTPSEKFSLSLAKPPAIEEANFVMLDSDSE